MSPPIALWARAFFATCLWEGITLQALQPRLGVARGPLAATGLALNVLTHPALWYLFPRFHPWWLWLVVAEGVVWTVEAALLEFWVRRTAPAPRPLMWGAGAAIAANAVSTAVGLLGIY